LGWHWTDRRDEEQNVNEGQRVPLRLTEGGKGLLTGAKFPKSDGDARNEHDPETQDEASRVDLATHAVPLLCISTW
jgi:hypothetical protein